LKNLTKSWNSSWGSHAWRDSNPQPS